MYQEIFVHTLYVAFQYDAPYSSNTNHKKYEQKYYIYSYSKWNEYWNKKM